MRVRQAFLFIFLGVPYTAHPADPFFTGKSATAAVRFAIERIGDNTHGYADETREDSKPATRVAWNLSSSDFVLPDHQITVAASNAAGAMPHSMQQSNLHPSNQYNLDPSFWLTSFGSQHHNDVSDSSEPDSESHVTFSTQASTFAQSPQAARQSPSSRSHVSLSSASASNSSIREAIESYRKATMFVMPPDISSDSSDGDSGAHGARQNVVISSDSESEQSEHAHSTIDYLNRRVRIERDQLLHTAGNRARSSQSLHQNNTQHNQSHQVSSKGQPHRRVAFASSPSSKTLNSHVLPHELRHFHIVAETERRWKNLPEVCSHELYWSPFEIMQVCILLNFGRCSAKFMPRKPPRLSKPLGRKRN